eukprot:GHVP01067441.1.p1 GENE.GHVP01067441.1~~GHVP01067441.1.p1  ORF type:complete len:222 (+),score=40.86 GHVP01067441.1:32-697(+)
MNSKSEVKAGLAGAALMTVNGLLSNFSTSDFEPGNEPQHENPEGIKTGPQSVSPPTGVIRVQGKEEAGLSPVSETVASEEHESINFFFDVCSRRRERKGTSYAKLPELEFVLDLDDQNLSQVLERYTAVGRICDGSPAVNGYLLNADQQKNCPSMIAKMVFDNREFIFFISSSGSELFQLRFDLNGSLLKWEENPQVENTRIFSALENKKESYHQTRERGF